MSIRNALFALTLGLLSVISTPAFAEVWEGRYGVGETFDFKLYNADGTLDVDEADGGTEVSVSCNEGAETTATNDFVDEGSFYSITLTNAEMNCERIAVVIAATTTEVFFIQTINNASAMNPTRDVNVASMNSASIDNADFATAPGASGGLMISGSNAGTTTLGALTITGATTHTGATVHTGAVTMAAGLAITQSASNTAGLTITGNGTGNGATITSGSGATGTGLALVAASTNGTGMTTAGAGTGHGQQNTGGATGHGLRLVGGATSGNGIATSFTAPSASVAEWGIDATGTLSGTHSSTTADLGTNAPGTISDLPAMTLFFPTRNLSRGITSYDTATGIATFAAIDADITLTNGDPWLLVGTSPTSGGGGSAPTAAEVADAVWDEDMTAHQTQGTAGQVIGDSAADSDSIWALANTNLNATVSSRASQTSLDTVDDFLDTEIAAIQTRVNFLPAATAGTAGGVFIAGTNAATTVTTSFTTTFTGNVTGSVGSIGTGGITTGSFAAGAINAAAVGTGAFDADALATDAVNEIWSLTCPEPAAKPTWNSTTMQGWVCWLGAFSRNKVTQTSTTKTLRNDADNANLVQCTVSDDGTTFTLNECTP